MLYAALKNIKVQRAGISCPLLLLCFFSPSLLAMSDRPVPSTAAAATQIGLGLLVVLLLLFFLAWLVRRLNLVPGAMGAAGGMKVLAVLPLSNRERLILVQVGSEQLLLGVTQQQINLIHRLEEPLSTEGSQQAAFASLLDYWKQKTTRHRKGDSGDEER
ncbi:flagellar biosynthetic protein FliO [Marinospirillum alkaliphilum]|uniref:Flagellar protein n=1 Tax=Marinospirillum alkaliphilum DSM 21637 TaxID=1122209 RepID=A0A1K1VB32_9GAMM|nr:flagellar biosynthetic protein FliO [Marinospirillum alkaliphilum]SFX22345.1 Flagellar biosynthesis protein, FliO [Marinospirillum alkaliphilum DSM 21637]